MIMMIHYAEVAIILLSCIHHAFTKSVLLSDASNHISSVGGEKQSYGYKKTIFDEIVAANKDVLDLIEGDIKIKRSHDIHKRVAITNTAGLWTGNVLPYHFDSGFPDSEKGKIRVALAEIEQRTCIRFQELTRKPDSQAFISVISGGGCWSYIGKPTQGEQELSLGNGCLSRTTIQHEFMHALGFHHEQNRRDRDTYVIVNFDNILDGYQHNFDRVSVSGFQDFGGTYDHGSIMHYPRWAFSKNGLDTIVPTAAYQSKTLGGSTEIQQSDIDDINSLYSCNEILGAWSEWVVGQCNEICGEGQSELSRTCLFEGNEIHSCSGSSTRLGESCKNRDCVEDDWGPWQAVGTCSENCGDGEQQYRRECSGSYCPESVSGSLLKFELEMRQCFIRECGAGVDCDFEQNSLCGWVASESGDGQGKWDVKSASMASESIASNPIRNTIAGKYAYVVTPVVPGQSSIRSQIRLTSPVLPGLGFRKRRCLSFNYRLYGNTIGRLYVKQMRTNNRILMRRSVWRNKSYRWRTFKRTIYAWVNSKIQIEYRLWKKSQLNSNAEIDDIIIADGRC